MPKIPDPWDHHDWDSKEYVADWAARQDEREAERQQIFQLIANTLPHDKDAKISILDLGSGYGALSQFLLQYFSHAAAVCHDGSLEMQHWLEPENQRAI